jgi:chorismate dehydratase
VLLIKACLVPLSPAKLNQLDKIKVGIVNYLNTRPLLYGIRNSAVSEQIELTEDHPANIARLLVDGSIDMGLVPVAVIPHLNEYYINTDYCIGADGAVASVALFSQVEVQQVQKVLLDYQSRTSVALARVLMREYWKIQPQLADTKSDYRPMIKGTTAGVVIGDRALEQRRVSEYIYDLGAAWKDLTGLPFVFAAWISNKPLPADFIAAFNEANKLGVDNIEKVVAETPYPVFDLHQYYTKYIRYELDADKKLGLERFLQYLQAPVSS